MVILEQAQMDGTLLDGGNEWLDEEPFHIAELINEGNFRQIMKE
jgi:hypothetical protein